MRKDFRHKINRSGQKALGKQRVQRMKVYVKYIYLKSIIYLNLNIFQFNKISNFN